MDKKNNPKSEEKKYFDKKNSLSQDKLDLYESILGSVNAIVYIFDLVNLKMIYTNDGFKKILGFKKPLKDIPEATLLEIHHPEDKELLNEMKSFFKKNKKGTFTGIFQFINAEGKYIWLCTSCNIFRQNVKKNILEVVGVSINMQQLMPYHKNLKTITRINARLNNNDIISKLSRRERELLPFFAKGYKTREIADLIGLSFHTVNNHRKNIIKKLEVKNIASLVSFAVENNLH
jgi:PAS domain S-box-containing protein